jgi:hypothetical protein
MATSGQTVPFEELASVGQKTVVLVIAVKTHLLAQQAAMPRRILEPWPSVVFMVPLRRCRVADILIQIGHRRRFRQC